MYEFNPYDWHWLADDGRVFSSARLAIIDTSDDIYKGRKEAGAVTVWPRDENGDQTDAALQDVLTPYGLQTDFRAAKLAELAQYCAAAIVGGYSSEALGTAYAYPSGITDQINMMGSVTASLLPGLPSGWSTPFWCQDGSGAWGYSMHTAKQIQQAGSDGKAHVVSCQTALALLSEEVASAADAAAVASIVWHVD